MPADKRKQSAKSSKSCAFDYCESAEKSLGPPADEIPPKSKKRSPSPDPSSANESDTEAPLTNEKEMSSLLNSFGADVSKTLDAKRKRLASFTSATMKTSNKRYDDLFVFQQNQTEKILHEYGRHVTDVFSQWDSDMQKAKDADDKVEGIIKQLQKSLQQQRVIQNQRLLSLKDLHGEFMKTSTELAKLHKDQQANIHVELRKELSALQKKMMNDARQEEMLNVRKSLQSMLSQV